MKNSIRCCISCILPCGALDVIRIVHANGRVEEISGTVKAAEIMKAHPKHVLKKPSSPSEQGMMCPKIVVVPPDAQLQRGKIYFLMPKPPPPDHHPDKKQPTHQKTRSTRSSSTTTTTRKKKKREAADHRHQQTHYRGTACNNINNISMNNFLVSDRYLTEILSEKVSTSQRDRRRGRAGVWRPHLESISETPSEAYN